MNSPIQSLKNLLARDDSAELSLGFVDHNEVKRAGSYWLGPNISNRMRHADVKNALHQATKDRAAVAAKLQALPDRQRTILGVFERYGGALSGRLLQGEALARGFIDQADPTIAHYTHPDPNDPVNDLRTKLLLLSKANDGLGSIYFYANLQRRYPDLFLLDAARKQVAAAAPVPWPTPPRPPEPTTTYRRPVIETTLDLWTMAAGLQRAAQLEHHAPRRAGQERGEAITQADAALSGPAPVTARPGIALLRVVAKSRRHFSRARQRRH